MTSSRTSHLFPWVLAGTVATLVACGAGTSAPGQVGGSSTATTPPSATSSPVITSPPATSRPVTTSPSSTAAPGPTTTGTPTVQVVGSRVTYAWHWPNDTRHPGQVVNALRVPPVPLLVSIAAGGHPATAGDRTYSRVSFTFQGGFPDYRFAFTDRLIADPKGSVVPLRGDGVLRIVFTDAQAWTIQGSTHVVSTIRSQPTRPLSLLPAVDLRVVDYAQGGDYEGYLSYGLGVTGPSVHSNQHPAVRVVQVEKVTATGQHLYVVAVDVAATS